MVAQVNKLTFHKINHNHYEKRRIVLYYYSNIIQQMIIFIYLATKIKSLNDEVRRKCGYTTKMLGLLIDLLKAILRFNIKFLLEVLTYQKLIV